MPGLVIFDVDGTLVDSQAMICAAMARAFADAGLPAPQRAETLAIVGLSLPQAMAVLAPGLGAAAQAALAEGYKTAWRAIRDTGEFEEPPLFPGARAAVERLAAAGWTLGIATGKARRGLAHMLRAHGLERHFAVTQTADDAPSKPHPQMVAACLRETGTDPARAAVVGDTEFDMAMARAAGVRGIGVGWGYHPAERLHRGGAARILARFEELDAVLGDILAPPPAAAAAP